MSKLNIRPLNNEIRRNARPELVATALDKVQSAFDDLDVQVVNIDKSVNVTEAPPVEAPGQVSNLAEISKGVVLIRGIAHIEVIVQYTAPGAAEFRDMDGVEVQLETGDGIFPKGFFPFTGSFAETGVIGFFHPQPESEGINNWYVKIRSRNRWTDVDWADVPEIALTITGQSIDAAPPTGVVLAIDGVNDAEYQLHVTWIPPTTMGGVIGYHVKTQYFSDAGALTPDSPERIDTVPGYSTSQHYTGVERVPVVERYARAWVRSYTAAGAVSGWTASNIILISYTPSDDVIGPATGLTAAVAEYRTGQDGQQYGRITGTYTPPAGADLITVYVFEGTGPPLPAEYRSHMTIPVDGTLGQDFWYPRPEAGAELWIMVCPANSVLGYWRKPSVAEAETSVTLSAWHIPAQVTGFNVTVQSDAAGGTNSAQFIYTFTPPSDPEFWYCQIESRWATDGTFTTFVTDWERVFGDAKPGRSGLWPRPASNEYRQFRALSVGQAGQINYSSPPTVNVTVGSNPGLDLTQIDTSKVSELWIDPATGKFTTSAINLLKATGFNAAEFQVSGGSFGMKNLVVEKLLGSQLLVSNTLTIGMSSYGQIAISSSYIQLNNAQLYSPNYSALIVSTVQTQWQVDTQLVGGTTKAYCNYNAAQFDVATSFTSTFTHSGSNVSISYPAAWRSALSVDEAPAVSPTTLTLAKITPGGSDGSITISGTGRITAYTAPT